jgi:hypothetical protein
VWAEFNGSEEGQDFLDRRWRVDLYLDTLYPLLRCIAARPGNF